MPIDRRAFIGLTIGGTVGSLFTPIPWKLTDDVAIWTQNWPWIPRIPKYGKMEAEASLSKFDNSGGGISVLTVDGKPVVAYGNPEHPLSQGGVSPLAAAEVQMLYSPSRVKQPLKRDGDTFTPIGWDEAIALAAEKFGAAGQNAAAICGDETGTLAELTSAVTTQAGSDKFFPMPSEGVTAARAFQKMSGKGQVGYDFGSADFILAVGADVFQSWGTYLANAAAYDAAKPIAGKAAKGLVYAGPTKNRTAALCDTFVPLMPGQEAAFLLALAAELKKAGASGMAMDALNAASLPAPGVDAGVLAEVAKRLMAAKKPLIVAGSPFGQGGSEAAVMAAVTMTAMLGGPVTQIPDAPVALKGGMPRSKAAANDLPAFLAGETAPEALLVVDANPAYALPQAAQMAEALDKVGFLVCVTSFMDETAAKADLILPASMTLERWDDSYTPYGAPGPIYTMVKPVLKPVFDTRPAGDVLLAMAKAMGGDLGVNSFKDAIAAKAKAMGLAPKPGVTVADGAPVGELIAPPQAFGAVEFAGDGLTLAPLMLVNVGSGKLAIPPFSTVTIPLSELQGDTFRVGVNGATASKAGLVPGQKVTLSAGGASIKARVEIDEGVMNDVVAVPMGFGHTAWDVFSKGKGGNAAVVMTMATEAGTGSSTWVGSKVQIA